MDNEQQDAIKMAKEGHSFLLTGQAGSGKSWTVSKIVDALRKEGKMVEITATTGMAAAHHAHLGATTIHRLCGILDGRFDHEVIAKRIMQSASCQKLRQMDTLIIDEISMMSMRTFEQVDLVLRIVRGSNLRFGNVQLILSGDFFQLPPVPNANVDDPGTYCFASSTWKLAVPHHINLIKIHRQVEMDLVQAIQELSKGTGSEQTIQLMNRLSRNLPPGPAAVHLFQLRHDVEVFNSRKLLEMEGGETVYRSSDNGDCSSLDLRVPPFLHLKIGAPVVLNVNLSDVLVNGLHGVITAMDDEGPSVYFSSPGLNTKLKKYTFTVFDKTKMCDVAFRQQIPLTLAFAVTVHKSQGMSLDRVVIDCRNMRTPGQLGVAVGRAKTKKGLCVKNFSQKLLFPHPTCVSALYDSVSVSMDMCECLQTELGCVRASVDRNVDETTNHESYEEHSIDDEVEPPEDEHVADAIDVLVPDSTANDTQVVIDDSSTCNLSISVLRDIIHDMEHKTPETREQHKENKLLKYLEVNENLTLNFANKVWQEINENMIPHVRKESVIHSNVKKYYEDIHKFMSSNDYVDMVRALFKEKPEKEHSNIAYKLCRALREQSLKVEAKPVLDTAQSISGPSAKNFKQSDAGRGTQRYIGGWCVAKLKHAKKQFIRRNLYKSSVVDAVNRTDNEVKYLEHLGATMHDLKLITEDPASLQVIERRQNVSGSLQNITDAAYEFFVYLDDSIISYENKETLHLHGRKSYGYISQEILQNQAIFQSWRNLFDILNPESEIHEQSASTPLQAANPTLAGVLSCKKVSRHSETNIHEQVMEKLYKEVCTKYIKMSSSQFRRQYIRELKADKQEAHRKQIRMRASKRKKNMPFTFDTVVEDKSDGKIVSHRLLQSKCEEDSHFLSSGIFMKQQILILCTAYGAKAAKSATIAKLEALLTPLIIQAQTMPYPNAVVHKSSEQFEPVRKKGKSTVASSKGKAIAPKKSVKWPCGICNETCTSDAIACDLCDKWLHYSCVDLTTENLDSMDSDDDWYCPKCEKSIQDQ